ncbi:hypothetical protein A0H81_12864 [Grifola frondosa]|uniref:Metallo-beta-lactamase domain-containing protein n=1 Tax=Grifola frondosa TaxID=5627 RepID=A0A1C7LQT9_GRIFR|nr:hypothetical protein A0H81_12864 [Grifola frondosa]
MNVYSTEVAETMSLPPPVENQAYCDVSALEAGHIEIPLAWVIDTAKDDEKAFLPALSFLLRHTTNHDTFVFDLGIRKDWETLPPAYVARIKKMGFRVSVPQDAAASLLRGGMPATDIAHVCLSHLHFDHTGDPALFPRATFLAGAGGRAFLAPGYPTDADSLFAGDLLPADRTRWLEPVGWPPLGPFAHALDFYGDGSLYVVDAGAGHFPGHVNVLARTSGDGGGCSWRGTARMTGGCSRGRRGSRGIVCWGVRIGMGRRRRSISGG